MNAGNLLVITRRGRWVAASLVAALIASPASPAADPAPAHESARPLIAAYYYPWYVKDDWTRHGYVGTPVLGRYGTDDPAVAARHIDWAADAGIDALVVSWWGEEHLASRHATAGLLRAPNLERIRYCLIYESLGRLDAADGQEDGICDFADPAVRRQFTADLRQLRNTHLAHPRYLRFAGKPVLVLYVSRTFRNCDRALIEAAQREAGIDAYLIADEPFFGEQRDPTTARNGLDAEGRPVFDAYTAYNMFESGLVREGESATDYMKREGWPVFEAWAARTTMFPHVMPSYHDFRGHKPLAGGVEGFTEQLGAARKLGAREAAAAGEGNAQAAGGPPHLIFITSFNEWWEGTTIEPAAEYGTRYLDAIRATFGPQREAR